MSRFRVSFMLFGLFLTGVSLYAQKFIIIPADMVRVKGGEFEMGDFLGEGNANEKPAHRVTVADFLMGKHEVAFEEYDVFCAETGRQKPSDIVGASWGRGRCPVVNVTWYGAVEYCNWLSQKRNCTPCYNIDKNHTDANNLDSYDKIRWTVRCNLKADGYRLPAEAEWEYAAREQGKKVRFGNGKNTAGPAEINFDGSETKKQSYSTAGPYTRSTVVTGRYAPNALGLYDMSGNVAEWCWDWYDEGYYGQSGRA